MNLDFKAHIFIPLLVLSVIIVVFMFMITHEQEVNPNTENTQKQDNLLEVDTINQQLDDLDLDLGAIDIDLDQVDQEINELEQQILDGTQI